MKNDIEREVKAEYFELFKIKNLDYDTNVQGNISSYV